MGQSLPAYPVVLDGHELSDLFHCNSLTYIPVMKTELRSDVLLSKSHPASETAVYPAASAQGFFGRWM